MLLLHLEKLLLPIENESMLKLTYEHLYLSFGFLISYILSPILKWHIQVANYNMF